MPRKTKKQKAKAKKQRIKQQRLRQTIQLKTQDKSPENSEKSISDNVYSFAHRSQKKPISQISVYSNHQWVYKDLMRILLFSILAFSLEAVVYWALRGRF